ncbi:MAG TPA: DUF3090 family protein [Methylomirabilota bacterium]|nr:DUF3090 family protein [Methylomirabilota bacterium]
MSQSFELHAPDHFTAGAVGPPGERTFYLQASQVDTLVTLKSEKEHVRVLGEYLAELLAKLPPVSKEPPRDLALLEPINPVWAIGSLGVGYDGEDDRVVVLAEELVEEEEGADEPAEERATARFRITRAQAAAFIECARDLVKAGRPICQICGHAIDPGGHVCPRRNGHGAR